MDEQVKLLTSKALDAIRICEQRNIPKFLGFLSAGESAAVQRATFGRGNICFFGGYKGAERMVFGALPDYLEGSTDSFPIKALKITFNRNFTLSHRDILGAFMSSGVERSTVGDILIFNGEAYVLVLEEMVNYFLNQIDKIKNVGVLVSVVDDLSLIPSNQNQGIEEIRFTVSSPRLDAVVSKLTGKSRTICESLILDGKVFINSFEVLKQTKRVENGDIITVRGFGKYKLYSRGDISKKGREIFTAQKYI